MRYSHTRYQHRAQDKKFLTFHRQFFQFRAPRPIFRLPTFVKLLFSRKSISGRKLELVSLQTTLCAPPGLCEILLDTSTGATTELNEWPRLWCRSFHHAIPFDYIFFFLTAYLNFHNIIYQLARRRRETQSVFPILFNFAAPSNSINAHKVKGHLRLDMPINHHEIVQHPIFWSTYKSKLSQNR